MYSVLHVLLHVHGLSFLDLELTDDEAALRLASASNLLKLIIKIIMKA